MKRVNLKLSDKKHAYLKAQAAMKMITLQDYIESQLPDEPKQKPKP